MVANFSKKKSKRQSCAKRYKIQKKIKEHKRKESRAKNKSSAHKKKKDPGIPNSLPFKDDILKEAEDRKRRIEEERERQKQRRIKEKEKLLAQKRKMSLSNLAADAQKRTAEFEKKNSAKEVNDSLQDYSSGKSVESSRKAYYKEFKKVIDAADVVLEILDARDPIGSRCQEVEQAVINAGTKKKLVLILNKIDLVPREIVEKWLKHLRNEFPTIAFKASTQDQRDNLSRVNVKFQNLTEEMSKSSKALGADVVMKLLNNYCRNKDIKTSISVGVVGFPNTGKSSIINSLKRSRVCNVGAMPGVTKAMQEIQLDKHVKLLDSPGVVMAKGNSDAAVILRNCVKIETVDDPTAPVEAILRRCNKEKLMLHYKIQDFNDVNEFLQLLAKRFGKLKKGGIPDMNKAARTILKDWTSGRITYYTHPPESHTLPTHLSAEIVKTMGQEFDIDALTSSDEQVLKGLKPLRSDHIKIESDGWMPGIVDEDDDGMENDDDDEWEDEVEEMVDDDEINDDTLQAAVTVEVTKRTSRTSSKSSVKIEPKKKPSDVEEAKTNNQLNKARKMEYKKMQKKRKRADKIGEKLSNVLTGAMQLGDDEDSDGDYNFETDFK